MRLRCVPTPPAAAKYNGQHLTHVDKNSPSEVRRATGSTGWYGRSQLLGGGVRGAALADSSLVPFFMHPENPLAALMTDLSGWQASRKNSVPTLEKQETSNNVQKKFAHMFNNIFFPLSYFCFYEFKASEVNELWAKSLGFIPPWLLLSEVGVCVCEPKLWLEHSGGLQSLQIESC